MIIYILAMTTNEEREVNMELLQEAVQSSRSSMGKIFCRNPSASYCIRQSCCLRMNGKHDAYKYTFLDGNQNNFLIYLLIIY